MDIFKIRLNKALSSNRIGKLEEFLLKEGQRNKDKIRKYADYILKNCSDYNWITSYLIMYDGDELIDAIINNYNKLKENNIDTYPIINRITKYPNDKLISYIDKLIPNGKYFCAGYDRKGNDVYIELYSNIKKK